MFAKIGRFLIPSRVFRFSCVLKPVMLFAFFLFFLAGAAWGLFFSPPDYQQGDAVRILYLHVPAAALSMGIYVLLAVSAIFYYIWHLKLADSVARAAAPIGAVMTLITLITGSLWGRPTWGTYWIWDARLTSELILLFIYLGLIAVRQAIADPKLSGKATALVACVGLINLPIIHYSVKWWHTLHQGTTVLALAKPHMPMSMLWPLLMMMLAYASLVAYLLLQAVATDLLEDQPTAQWAQNYLHGRK